MSMRKFLTISGLVLLATALHARETAVLRNGFGIPHDHRQQLGATTRLFLTTSEQEYVDVRSDDIASFEKEEIAPPSPDQGVKATTPNVQISASLQDIVEKASRENQLDSDFVHAVIRAESNGKANAVSPKGAQGLMQLMPQTAAKLGVRNSFDPGENVSAGTKYLRDLLARYQNDPIRALAAYNAGAGRVQQYHGVPPYKETRAYIASIIRDFNRRKLEQARVAKNSRKSIQASAANRPPIGD
jgi:soluble lytic murein transglycosylase-like protein